MKIEDEQPRRQPVKLKRAQGTQGKFALFFFAPFYLPVPSKAFALPSLRHPVSSRASSFSDTHLPSLAGRAYSCKCGRPVFFRNSQCLACSTPLGYDPQLGQLLSLAPTDAPDDTSNGTSKLWRAWPISEAPEAAKGWEVSSYRRCLNLTTPAACNWLVSATDTFGNSTGLCRACQLNHKIPDLNDPEHPDNGQLWGLVELAKRRLVSALMVLGLPVASKLTEDPEHGLMFDFLRSDSEGGHVMTGHDTGLITISLVEADDATREAARQAMHEPYRTLLGHFRHEVGHYYWDRLVWGTGWMNGFHSLFGDETAGYAEALQRHYDDGPAADWPQHYVSAYASTHPWEDWAECWAHYLHMRDTVDTASSFGLSAKKMQLEFTPFAIDALYQPKHPKAKQFLAFLNDWTRLTTLLNEMSRSMGQPDFYPFVLPREVVAKLHFIHLLVTSTGESASKGKVATAGKALS